MYKGQAVVTKLGNGVVLGFEAFDENGKQLPNSVKDNGRRVQVQLDNPSNWIGYETHGHPYFFRSDLHEFKP